MTPLTRRQALTGLGTLAAPAVARAQGGAGPGEAFRIGLVRLPSSGPVYVAQERGYFRDEGLAAELVFFDAAAAVPTAVVSRDLDVGVVGLTAAAFNLAAKNGIRILAAQSREAPGFKLNAFLETRRAEEAGLTGLDKLPGRRFGYTTAGSTMHYNVGLVARKYGFDLGQVTLVPLQSLSNLYAAFEGGGIEAALLPALPSERFARGGKGRILAWAGDVTPYQQGAVIASPHGIEARRPALERFVRAYQRAAAEYNAAFCGRDAAGAQVRGPGHDELLAMIARGAGQNAADLVGHLPLIDGKARLDVGSLYDQIAFWQGRKLVDPAAKPEAMFDLSFVPDQLNVPSTAG